MRKIFKFFKLRDIVFFIIGAVIFGTVSAVATNYLLRAEDVEYIDKDNKSTTVQSAITDLYNKAKKGGFETLSIGEIQIAGNSISIPYEEEYIATACIYGEDENYNAIGTIKDGGCVIYGNVNTTYYYRLLAIDESGKVYEYKGNSRTGSSGATMQTTNLVSSTGTTYQGLLGIVYLDPTNLGTVCNVSNYSETSSTTGTKTGCMRWYAYKLQNGNYSLLLDHNTTAISYYNYYQDNSSYGNRNASELSSSYNEIGYDLAQLISESGWVVTPRLITVDEIAKIVGYTNWSSTTNTNWFYFDSRTTTKTATSQGASAYAWLYDYTKNCTSNGCNTADSLTQGYWTDSKYLDDYTIVWSVFFNGSFDKGGASNAYYGLRPVIEVPSSILSIS